MSEMIKTQIRNIHCPHQEIGCAPWRHSNRVFEVLRGSNDCYEGNLLCCCQTCVLITSWVDQKFTITWMELSMLSQYQWKHGKARNFERERGGIGFAGAGKNHKGRGLKGRIGRCRSFVQYGWETKRPSVSVPPIQLPSGNGHRNKCATTSARGSSYKMNRLPSLVYINTGFALLWVRGA